MSQENKSLTAIALQKFKQNFWGVFSFGYIVLMVFLALFAYVFSPDDTENANQMHLSIHSQSPGFEVKMISVPNEFLSPKTFKSYFFGSTNQITEIPIKAYVIKNDVLHYIEYNDDESIQIEKEITLDKFYGYSSFKEVEKELITDKKFYLGTDKYGRDLLSRMLVGSRVSISIGFVAVLISVLVGLFFGSLGGFYGGKVDAAVMWLVNVIWSIPTLLLVIAITLALGKGFWQVFVAVGLTMWVEVARVVRGQIISVKEMQYVTAARALGFSNIRIIINHILPNIYGTCYCNFSGQFCLCYFGGKWVEFFGVRCSTANS